MERNSLLHMSLIRPVILAGCLVVLSALPVLADASLVLVDTQPPQVEIIKPLDGESLAIDRPWLEAQVNDWDAGINQDKIIISIDGVDVTSEAIIERMDLREIGVAKQWRVRYQPPIALASGQHRVQIDVTDIAGNYTRRQWHFYIQVGEPQVNWDAGLTNVLNYAYRPLEKVDNTTNFTSQLQVQDQRFRLQFQTSAADYPGRRTEPNYGEYYVDLNQYIFGWQSKYFDLQHGDLNLPFESGLLQFGLGFEGTCIANNNQYNQMHQWTIFQGTTVDSFGLAISQTETTGGIYRRQTATNKMQAYLLQLESLNSSKVVGFQDDRIFERGVLRYELIYGQTEEVDSGGGIRVQGGASLADIFWDVDWILFQESYPLLATSPLASTQGGAYQYTIRGAKLLPEEKRLDIAYSLMEDNLDDSREETQKNQSLQMNYTGLFAPDFGWLLGYQGGLRQGFAKTEQQTIKFGTNRRIEDTIWNSNLWLSEDDTEKIGSSKRYQWDIGYSKPSERFDLKTSVLLQWTREDKVNNQQDNSIELRGTIEKELFQDLARSYLVIAYKTEDEERNANDVTNVELLNIEGTLNLKLGNKNSFLLSGKISFWENDSSLVDHGQDYTLNLSWQSRL